MKNLFSVLLIFVVLYMFYIPITYLKYTREEDVEFSALVLSKAVDYAGEAAISACMTRSDLEMQYTDDDYLQLTPDKAANAFASTLCLSYGIPAVKSNIDEIITKIPTMIFAVNNGYYLAEWQNIADDGMELMWQPKRAYIVDTSPDTSSSGMAYGVELNMGAVNIVNKQILSITHSTSYNGLPFDKEAMLQYINRTINRDVNAVLTRYAINWNKDIVQSFYLPVSGGTTGVRRIEKPGLLIIVQGLNLDGIAAHNLSVINGMQITQKRTVLGWTDGNGRKYYSYSDKVDSTAKSWIAVNGVMFGSIEEAAGDGYVPCVVW